MGGPGGSGGKVNPLVEKLGLPFEMGAPGTTKADPGKSPLESAREAKGTVTDEMFEAKKQEV